MKNNKIIVFALVGILAFISIGYALYSTVLNINGIANVNRSVWSIHYDSDSVSVLSGTNLVAPTSGPTISNDLKKISFETNLNINEQSAFTVDVINDGTFTARVSSINLKVYSKKEDETNYTTLANVSSNKWSNDYLDISVLWTEDNRNLLDTVDLQPSTTKNMTVRVKYKQPEDYTLLPSNNMNFKFDLSVEYTQANSISGETNYIPKVTSNISTPAELLTALDNSDTVLRLNEDIDLTDYDSINIDGNVTIEFNGNRITVAPNSIEVRGTLILEDSDNNGGLTSDRGVVNVMNGGTLIVNGGQYTTTNYTRGSGIYVEEGGKVIINDGIFNAAYYSIGTEGNVDITINGGELNSSSTSKSGTWAYSVKLTDGTFTMNGGKISGVQGALALDGSVDAIINNGEIYVHETNQGDNDSYYDIYITGDSTLDIYNGNFKNDGTRSVIYTTSSNNTKLYGGNYKAQGNTLFTGNNIKIYGGTYSHDVSNYLESGTLSSNNGTYTVGE